ncbi:MAG TPA: sugar phosphate nucleotidyltransferase [Flavisolibacter sp.]
MIFSAGLGTRFKPWTDTHPKALAVVNGKSLLQRNIEYLRQFGISDVVVNVHHFPGQIREALEKNHGWGSNVTVSDETGELLETGGGLLKARHLLGGGAFLTINVDILTDAPLDQMMEAHRREEALITLAVTDRRTSRYLLFNVMNRLCGWRNVSTGEERISFPADHYTQKAFSGIAIFDPSIFGLIRFDGRFSLIDVFLDLAAGHKIVGFDHSGTRFIDVGKPDSVAAAEQLFS